MEEFSSEFYTWLAIEHGLDANDFLKSDGPDDFCIQAPILKMDDEQHMVYGYASVIECAGETVVDLQKDTIDEADLVKTAHDFMTSYRQGKSMHKGDATGTIVESIVFTKDLQAALGIDLGMVGWFIGYHVDSDATWEKVKKGEYRAFSIGGSGTREKVEL